MAKQWWSSHAALDGCQVGMPLPGSSKNTENLILLPLSFLISNLGNGWGTFRLTGAK